jgi:dephospho-CoA kinase
VSAPVPLRVARVLQRDPHRQPADVQAIIDKQLPEAERQARADFVIRNDDRQLVIPQVLAIHQQLLALAASRGCQNQEPAAGAGL